MSDTLTLTITKTLPAEQVADLIEMIGSYSWWQDVTTDWEARTVTLTIDDPDHSETEAVPLTKTVTFQHVLDALGAAYIAKTPFCCWDDMVNDELGLGCADDADLLGQWIMFSEIVYG